MIEAGLDKFCATETLQTYEVTVEQIFRAMYSILEERRNLIRR